MFLRRIRIRHDPCLGKIWFLEIAGTCDWGGLKCLGWLARLDDDGGSRRSRNVAVDFDGSSAGCFSPSICARVGVSS